MRRRLIAVGAGSLLAASLLVLGAVPASAQTAPSFTASGESPPTTATVGVAYSYQFTAAGTSPITYSVPSGGTLPPGLSLDSSTGVLSGKPTTIGSYTFTVQGANGTTPTAVTPSITIVVSAPTAPSFTAVSPPAAAQNYSYSYQFAASGSPAPTFSVASGSVPPGLGLSSSGLLSGVPTTIGSFSFVLQASNSVGSVTSTVTVSVTAPLRPSFTADSPPTALALGAAFVGYTFVANGSPAPTYAILSGSLPPGLSLNTTTGLLSGTPTTAGSYTFVVEAVNVVGYSSTPVITMSVNYPSPPVFTADSPPSSAEVGQAYSYTFTSSGSPAPFFFVGSGSLPPGITLDESTGVLSGTPTSGGSFTFTVQVTNTYGSSVTPSLTINVVAPSAPAFTRASPPRTARIGTSLAYRFTASGYPAPTFSKVRGTLPPGLSLDASTGVLSGTLRAAGTFTFTIGASNGVGTPAERSVTIEVVAPTIRFTTASSFALKARVYAKELIAATGSPKPHLSATGTLPKGMRLVPAYGGSAFFFAGTPYASAAGSYTLDLSATNGVAPAAHQVVHVTVAGLTPVVRRVAPRLEGGTAISTKVGAYAKLRITATGSPTPRFSLTGTLPAGLRFVTKAGVPYCFIAGKPAPSASGSHEVVVTAFNGVGTPASEIVHISVAGLAPPTPPPAAKAAGYWYATSTGEVVHEGSAVLYRSASKQGPRAVVAMAAPPDGKGYWLVSSFGAVYNYGDAGFYGSLAATPPSSPIVAFGVTPDGKGYWLVSRSGNVYHFGDAVLYGSPANVALTAPVAAFAVTPDGKGYWVVTMSGAVYPYGDAQAYSSLTVNARVSPIVAIASTPDGKGYWLVSSTGAVYNYGDAASYGSPLPRKIRPVVAFAATPDGRGYWMVTDKGNVYNYGDAPYFGSSSSTLLSGKVTAFAPFVG